MLHKKILVLFFLIPSISWASIALDIDFDYELAKEKAQKIEQSIAKFKSKKGKKFLKKLFELQELEIQMGNYELYKLEEKKQELLIRRESVQENFLQRKKQLRLQLSTIPALHYKHPMKKSAEASTTMDSMYLYTLKNILKSFKSEIGKVNRLKSELSTLNLEIDDEKEKVLAHLQDLNEKQSILNLNKKAAKERVVKAGKYLQKYQKEKVQRLNVAKEIHKLNQSANESLQAKGSFLQQKGKLQLPVQGKIVKYFGKKYNPRTSLYSFHKGISIDVTEEEFVHSVYDGKIVFQGRMGGYGKLVIIDHGDQYYSLIGHVGRLFKKKGDLVKAGEVVAQISKQNKQLYFEIRRKHVALNPMPWLDLKSKKAL